MNSRALAALLPMIRASGICELVQLKAGLRNACRISLPYNLEASFMETCKTLGFHVSRSFLPVKGDTQCCTFFNNDGNPWATYLYYVSGSEANSVLAASSEGLNYTLHGKLFGYPPCCIRFFEANSRNMHNDMTLLVRAHEGYNYLINRTTKSIGYSLISHFPCSWSCAASVSLAKKTIYELGCIDPVLASKLTDIINSNVYYTAGSSLFCKRRAAGENESAVFASYGLLPEAAAMKAENNAVFLLRNSGWEHAPGWHYLPFSDNRHEAFTPLH